eukprot:1260280-Pleurochrysis_carterae.AAC.1
MKGPAKKRWGRRRPPTRAHAHYSSRPGRAHQNRLSCQAHLYFLSRRVHSRRPRLREWRRKVQHTHLHQQRSRRLAPRRRCLRREARRGAGLADTRPKRRRAVHPCCDCCPWARAACACSVAEMATRAAIRALRHTSPPTSQPRPAIELSMAARKRLAGARPKARARAESSQAASLARGACSPMRMPRGGQRARARRKRVRIGGPADAEHTRVTLRVEWC